jgi:hypothetical protein
MNVDFEIFQAGPQIQHLDRPHVTISKLGHVFLNRHALALLGHPDAVTLMFDRRRKLIGILPSDRRRPHSYPLRKKDGQSSRGRMLHAMNFCKHYGIRVSETLAFLNPEINKDGVLVLNLHEVRSVKKV